MRNSGYRHLALVYFPKDPMWHQPQVFHLSGKTVEECEQELDQYWSTRAMKHVTKEVHVYPITQVHQYEHKVPVKE